MAEKNIEVGQHVCLQGTGKWYEGQVHFATIADVSNDTVKVRFTDGGYKRMPTAEFRRLWTDLQTDAAIVNEVITETFEKLPTAPDQYTKLHQLQDDIMQAVKTGDFLKADSIKKEYAKLAEKTDRLKNLRDQLADAIARQDFVKAHEVQQQLKGVDKKPVEKPDFSTQMKKAGSRALGGGIAGASAMVMQVGSLMWMRTIMNYQYRNGGTFMGSFRTLWAEGGIPRLYSGLGPALIQGPVSRFGDTFANAGVLALFDSSDSLRNVPMFGQTIFASASAAGMRIFLTPVDTVKTMMQANGKEGIPMLRAKLKAGGPSVMFHGATATMAATFVGHYPYFSTFNTLQESVPVPKDTLSKLLRNAGIGFAASIASDTISNSLRVIKTVRQTNATMPYKEIVSSIVEKEGYVGLFGRGLQTRLLCNGCQGMMFSVVYKYVEGEMKKK
jgi:hypothetical protein